MSADLTADLDRFEGLSAKATEGPWEFAAAPAEGSDETPAEWMAAGLTGQGPLYTLYVPATVGDPGGFVVPAVTGDGPNARNNAAFIADARTTVPDLVAVVRAVLALTESWRYKGEFGWGAWQEGQGPDQEGYILDQAAADIRTAITKAWEARR